MCVQAGVPLTYGLTAAYSVALTGAAGPEAHGGAEPGPEWIALEAGDARHHHPFRWPYDRELVRRLSELAALDLVRRQLLGLPFPD